ncbi:MAG: AzlC family ABC transporter permease, partial [Candidatus Ornithospirochaeta sp.]
MGSKSENFRRGILDGIPIALGYFAVSFTLGIRGMDVGLKWYQSALMSATNYTSAGQAAALTILEEGGSFVELVISTLVINLRYLLMSAALTVKLSPTESTANRMLMGIGVTDEIFGIAVARKTPLSPFYNLGAMSVACPGWVLGTALGGIVGEILPPVVASSLSIALYAMFLAIIIPPARENKVVAVLVVTSMALSFIFTQIPFLSGISTGMKV